MSMRSAATVIRGKGICELFINGIRDEEVHRINKLHNEEIEIMKNELKKTKDRIAAMPIDMCKKEQLCRKIIKFRYGEFVKPSLFDRIKDDIVFVWACIWVFGCKHGLWGYWDDEENESFRQELREWKK